MLNPQTATYKISFVSSDIESSIMRVDLHLEKSESEKVHVARVEIQFPSDDETLSVKFVPTANAHENMPLSNDLDLLARTLTTIYDAYTEDHDLYDEVFVNAEEELVPLSFTIAK